MKPDSHAIKQTRRPEHKPEATVPRDKEAAVPPDEYEGIDCLFLARADELYRLNGLSPLMAIAAAVEDIGVKHAILLARAAEIRRDYRLSDRAIEDIDIVHADVGSEPFKRIVAELCGTPPEEIVRRLQDRLADGRWNGLAIARALDKTSAPAPASRCLWPRTGSGVRRAITLAGGGPAAGLHIGALERLREAGITFEVWALSCIGAWVGVVYNQCDKNNEVEQTYNFFHDNVFRPDDSYSRFPVNTAFGPDLRANTRAMIEFMFSLGSYKDIWLPDKIADAAVKTASFLCDPTKWNEGDANNWVLDQVLAVHPASRFMTSLLYLSQVNGLSRIYYPDSSFLKKIRIERLFDGGKPLLYHNAWNLTKKKRQLFVNRRNHPDGYGELTRESLCACSALPYVEETIDIAGDTYCEGALVDTVNFDKLLEHHPDLEEIWVSRIVDVNQVRAPRDMHDALANLCMLFAASLGADDVRLFRYHAREAGWKGRIVEIPVATNINFEWTHSNLDRGRRDGYEAVTELLKQ